MDSAVDLVREGNEALDRGDAASARTAFESALARHGESGAILDGFAQAAYVDGDFDSAIELLERAYSAYRDEGNHVGAIHAASKLGWLNAAYRGDGAVMSGWISRAQTLVGDADTVEHGWVEYYLGMFEALGPEREAHLRTALEAGRRFGDGDLEFVALAQLGQGYVAQGRFEEGMLLLDEALAGVAGGEAGTSTSSRSSSASCSPPASTRTMSCEPTNGSASAKRSRSGDAFRLSPRGAARTTAGS